MPEPTATLAQKVAPNVSTEKLDEAPNTLAGNSLAESTTEISELVEQLNTLNTHLSRKTSLRFLFAAAMLQGLGYLLGATVVASIVVAIAVRFLSTLNFPEMINELIGSIELPSASQQIDFRQYPF